MEIKSARTRLFLWAWNNFYSIWLGSALKEEESRHGVGTLVVLPERLRVILRSGGATAASPPTLPLPSVPERSKLLFPPLSLSLFPRFDEALRSKLSSCCRGDKQTFCGASIWWSPAKLMLTNKVVDEHPAPFSSKTHVSFIYHSLPIMRA